MFGAIGAAKGFCEAAGFADGLVELGPAASDGAGLGMDGGVENRGRASSRKENVGTAEESAKPSELGNAGAGG